MYHQIAEVNQDPAAGRAALNAARNRAGLLLGIQRDVIGQRLKLPLVIAITDQEIVGKDGLFANVKQDNVAALLVEDGVDKLMGQF